MVPLRNARANNRNSLPPRSLLGLPAQTARGFRAPFQHVTRTEAWPNRVGHCPCQHSLDRGIHLLRETGFCFPQVVACRLQPFQVKIEFVPEGGNRRPGFARNFGFDCERYCPGTPRRIQRHAARSVDTREKKQIATTGCHTIPRNYSSLS